MEHEMDPGNVNHDRCRAASLKRSILISLELRRTSQISEIDAQILALVRERARALSVSSAIESLPNEISLEILKSLPNLDALRSMILCSKNFYLLFQSRREKILFNVLRNDIGKDVLIDYMQMSFLMSTPHVASLPKLHYGPIDVFRLKQTIRQRKATSPPRKFNRLPEPKFVYIARQAQLVREVVDMLVHEVLFGSILPGPCGKSAKVVHHEFLENLPWTIRVHEDFNPAVLKQELSPDELLRFKRGLHRLHFCRLLCTGGMGARSRTSKDLPSGWHPELKDFRVFADWSSRCERPTTVRAAVIAEYDSLFEVNSCERPLIAFVLSLPPWEREELTACAQLVARGYARAARSLTNFRLREVSNARVHDAALLHLRTLLLVSKEPDRIFEDVHLYTRGPGLSNYHGMGRVLWEILHEYPPSATIDTSLEEHLLRRKINGPQSWITRGNTEGPYAARFDSEAPPLYRAMVELLKADPRDGTIKPQQFIEDCWVMWSNPARLRAWPRWPALKTILQRIEPTLFA